MKGWVPVAALAVGLAPVVVLAPRAGRTTAESVRGIAEAARSTGAEGWDLVDAATAAVAGAFDHYSAWHLWETPRRALHHGRGQSSQYNLVLAEVLGDLGIPSQVVHAAWVRWVPDAGEAGNPWFHRGHLWLRVTIGGSTRDVCASRITNRAGSVPFVPLSEVREVRSLTPLWMSVALLPFVATQVWRQTLRHEPPASWLYRPNPTSPDAD